MYRHANYIYTYVYVYQDIRLNIYSIISTYTNLSLKTCLRACPCELFLLLGEPELHRPQRPPGLDSMSAHDNRDLSWNSIMIRTMPAVAWSASGIRILACIASEIF